jgi:hypothetical protein
LDLQEEKREAAERAEAKVKRQKELQARLGPRGEPGEHGDRHNARDRAEPDSHRSANKLSHRRTTDWERMTQLKMTQRYRDSYNGGTQTHHRIAGTTIIG